MFAIQRRHCVPDEAGVLVTDTFQRGELAKGFGIKRAEVQICQINPISRLPTIQFNFEIPEEFPEQGMSAAAANGIVNNETWTDTNPMLNLSSFVTTYCEPAIGTPDWWIPRCIQCGAAFARHGKLGLHTANELVGRRSETIFAALLSVTLACTEMA